MNVQSLLKCVPRESTLDTAFHVLELSFVPSCVFNNSHTRRRPLHLLFSIDSSASMLEMCNAWQPDEAQHDALFEFRTLNADADADADAPAQPPRAAGKSKITYVCDTICAVLDWLHTVDDRDVYVAIQTFSNEVQMRLDCKSVPFQKQDLEHWKQVVNSLAQTADGLTNLEAALHSANTHLNCRVGSNVEAHHLLLTDGEITVGSNDVSHLNYLLGGHNHAMIGFGTDHDARLMSLLASMSPRTVEYRCVADETEVGALHGELVYNWLHRVPSPVLVRETGTESGAEGCGHLGNLEFYDFIENEWKQELILTRAISEKPLYIYVRVREPVASPSPVVRVSGSALVPTELAIHEAATGEKREMRVHVLRLKVLQCLADLHKWMLANSRNERAAAVRHTPPMTPCVRNRAQTHIQTHTHNHPYQPMQTHDASDCVTFVPRCDAANASTPPQSRHTHMHRCREQEEEGRTNEHRAWISRLNELKTEIQREHETTATATANTNATPSDEIRASILTMLLEDVMVALISVQSQSRNADMFVSARRWSQGRQDAHQGASLQWVKMHTAHTVQYDDAHMNRNDYMRDVDDQIRLSGGSGGRPISQTPYTTLQQRTAMLRTMA